MRKIYQVLFFIFLLGCQKDTPINSFLKQPFLIWGFSIEGFPIAENDLELLEQQTKIPAQLIQFYLQWPAAATGPFTPIQPSLNAIASKGAIACITWEPKTIEGVKTTISYENILNGQYDHYLIHMANEMKNWNKPLIIRFAHEMNLDTYHWGSSNLEQFNSDSPEHYIKMFRYIVDLFKNQGANQVLWAFCPNVESVPNETWNIPNRYYPGDEYVDILGMDGYNWDITKEIATKKKQSWTKPWSSFKQIFEKLYLELKEITPQKPILVFETASVDRKGDQKSLWVKEAIQTAKEWNLLGIIWFQIKKEEDWRINQDDNYQYVPFVRSAINPLQSWLQKYLENKVNSNN